MIPELGHFALVLALLFALLQCFIPFVGAWRDHSQLLRCAKPFALAQAFWLAVAFACLEWAFFSNDFSVAYVAANSNSHLPLFYQLTALWSAHEGSLLLWVVILALWTTLVCFFSKGLPLAMQARVLAVLGGISSGFLWFLLQLSNPFKRLLPNMPIDGMDLNPLLQDPGLVIHPPMLYMGYVGTSVAFAFAIAALWRGKLDIAWVRWSLPWTLVAWCFLTWGITLGSWWSYRDLGWGGWWFWDPVENASFMPWLVVTALIHSLLVTEKRGAFKNWSVFLAILAFALSLMGTFLVRSGILTSVHAFAVDAERGAFLLKFLSLVIMFSFVLYAWRAPLMTPGGIFKWLSRESFLLANNVLLFVLMLTVLLGTLYPLVLDALGIAKISVGPPYFNAVFLPLTTVLFLLMGMAPVVRWQQMPVQLLMNRVAWVLPFSIIAAIALPWLLMASVSLTTVIGLTMSFWIIAICLQDFGLKWLQRTALTSRYCGMILAHLGVAVTVIGITLTSSYSIEQDAAVALHQPTTLGPYQVTLVALHDLQGPNYRGVSGEFWVSGHGQPVELVAEKRLFMVSGSVMSIPAIDVGLWRDVYVALGDPLPGDLYGVRYYYKPFVRWIWFGGLLMVFGGVLALRQKIWRGPALLKKEVLTWCAKVSV